MDGQPLAGIKVLDIATLFAAPSAAALLADFGAEVIKVEHPVGGDPLRKFGAQRDGVSLWWKYVGRGKKSITLDLSTDTGQHVFKQLVQDADVVIENFRPGTLERWNLGYSVLSEMNSALVLVRVTGFGQTGPYSHRPAFGTLIEAMSGFAEMTGEQDGPPTLPGFPLADGIAGVMAAFATLTALRQRDSTGLGQVVDLSLLEAMTSVLGAQPTVYDQTGVIARRSGNRSRNNAPRNTYVTKDDRWVAVSAVALGVAERVITVIGRPDLAEQPWFATGPGRAEHAEDIDEALASWIGERTRSDVILAFEAAGAPVAPIYDVADLLQDEHVMARQSIVTVDDDELGELKMQGPPFRFGAEPVAPRRPGCALGEHNREIRDPIEPSSALTDCPATS